MSFFNALLAIGIFLLIFFFTPGVPVEPLIVPALLILATQ